MDDLEGPDTAPGPGRVTASGSAGSAPAALLPWDIHPALAEDRLRVCALLLARARRDAVTMASTELGDDAWSIGCRAYAFGRHRLVRLVEQRRHNWLTLLDDSHHFVFMIGGVPVRFFRGSADEPAGRTLRRQVLEAQQMSLALGEEQADGLVFRLAIEARADSQVDRIVFLALRGEAGTVECLWPIPLAPLPDARSGWDPRQLGLLDEATGIRRL